MEGPYSSLTHARVPVTDEDREVLRKAFRAALIAAAVLGAVSVGGLVFAIGHALGNLKDPVDAGIGFFFALLLLIMLAIAVWIVRRTSHDRAATEKVVFTGTITGKRTEHSTSHTHEHGHAHDTHSHQIISLDGVDFRVNAQVFADVQRGQRVALHCLRGQEVFRITPA